MEALAMILAVRMLVVESGPVKTSTEVEERLDLSGEWKGTWRHKDGEIMTACSSPDADNTIIGIMPGGYIFIPIASIIDEGEGRFRITGEGEFSGIYIEHDGLVVLCCRPAKEGYPTSFRGGKGQHLLVLHRPKAGK